MSTVPKKNRENAKDWTDAKEFVIKYVTLNKEVLSTKMVGVLMEEYRFKKHTSYTLITDLIGTNRIHFASGPNGRVLYPGPGKGSVKILPNNPQPKELPKAQPQEHRAYIPKEETIMTTAQPVKEEVPEIAQEEMTEEEQEKVPGTVGHSGAYQGRAICTHPRGQLDRFHLA